jgi:DNA-directed RNA polymerase specialized sigma24 family protein
MKSDASERLVDLAAPLLNYVARRLRYYEAIGDLEPEDAAPEDIVDAVYLEAGEHLRQRPARERSYRWLREIADLILSGEINRVRAARRAAGQPESATRGPGLVSLLPDPFAPIPEQVAESIELQQAIAHVLGDLHDSLREPLLLMAVDGYDVEAIAAMEDVEPSEAARRITTAAELLRRRLQREYRDAEPPSPEQIFRLVEQITPSATDAARAREQLQAPSQPAD